MRIGLLSAAVSRAGGGVFEAVVVHARLLASLGHEVVAIGLKDRHSAADRRRFGTVQVRTARRWGPLTVGYAPGLLAKLDDADLDLLHLHGIWQYPSRAAELWARRTGRPYVISPHGMLDPWITARGGLKKSLAKMGYERASWLRADMFHALTGAEAQDIRAETGSDRVTIIPNAVSPQQATNAGEPGNPYFLFISRIHPKKNVEALVEAWSAARRDAGLEHQRLLICGWGEAGSVAQLEARLAALGDPSIEFLGPVFDERKDVLIQGASFVVLPSFSEGLPMTMLEAWAAGVPTLMTKGCNLPIGFERNAALDCGVTVNSIKNALLRGARMGVEEREKMAKQAQLLADTEFAPARIAKAWDTLYRRLCEART